MERRDWRKRGDRETEQILTNICGEVDGALHDGPTHGGGGGGTDCLLVASRRSRALISDIMCSAGSRCCRTHESMVKVGGVGPAGWWVVEAILASAANALVVYGRPLQAFQTRALPA